MKLLSSNLSKPRRRLYSLLTVGSLVAGLVVAVGALIVVLGHGSPDVTLPFWECGQYLLLLSLFNLGIYLAAGWQLGRLSRREGRGPAAALPRLTDDLPERSTLPPVEAPAREKLSAPVQVSRRVRGTVSSLNLDP